MSVSKENLTQLESFLETFEDPSFNTPHHRSSNYQQIKDILESAKHVNQELLDKLLAACTEDLKPGIGYLPNVLNTVIAILKKADTTLPSIQPSALAVVDIINALATLNKIGSLKILSLKTMCFDTLLAFPNAALEFLVATKCEKLLKIIEVYCSSLMTPECRRSAFQMLKRLLEILSPETKHRFVAAGVNIWFLKVVPTVVLAQAMNTSDSTELMDALDLLTDSLIHIEYSKNKHWNLIMECIYNPQKYTTVMKTLLENQNNMWHRLWIVLIRLLKDQIAKVANKTGSPINAMLPIVETAFKMDVETRCLAYKCWEALIDNFSSEQNEAFIIKRIKLLIIPLKAQNTKVEQTAEAKIKTWWHLIRRYHNHMGTLKNLVLIPFIQCCFGMPDKGLFVPGLMSEKLTATSVEMLVEIFGHVDCDRCVEIPPLQNSLITAEVLTEHWAEWLHALKSAIKFLSEQESERGTKQLRCLWKSVLRTMAKLPANKERDSMFKDVLAAVERLLQCNFISHKLADKIYEVMIVPMFERENSVLMLLDAKDEAENGPIHRILKILLDPVMASVISRKSSKDLKPITDVLLDKSVFAPNEIVDWLLQSLPQGENAVVLWNALAESICQTDYQISKSVMHKMITWPIKSTNSLISENTSTVAANNWIALFDSYQTQYQFDLDELLPVNLGNTVPAINFQLSVVLVLLKQNAALQNVSGYEKSIGVLHNLLTKVTSYTDVEKLFPMLVDSLCRMIDRLKQSVNVTWAEKILLILHIVIKLTAKHELPSNDIKRYLLKPLNELFQIEAYLPLKHIIVDDLIDCLATDKHTILKNNVLDILKTFMSKTSDVEFHAKVKAAVDSVEDSMPVATPAKLAKKPTSENTILTPTTPEVAKNIKTPTIIAISDLSKMTPIIVKKVRVPTPKNNNILTPTITNQEVGKDDMATPKTTPVKNGDMLNSIGNNFVIKVTSGKVVREPDVDKNDGTPKASAKNTIQEPIVENLAAMPRGITVNDAALKKASQAKIVQKSTVKQSDSTPSDISELSDKTNQKLTEINKVITPQATSAKTVEPSKEDVDVLKPKVVSTEILKTPLILKEDFTTPKTVDPNKKTKKKETKILDTVVENGVQYEVIKSHWKFNPRKLTDNQKEKLKRKREDIPALYQDLSQSQDDMKLNTWKTDSQDTTTTTSKSNSNSTSKAMSEMLKKIPSSDVVPKIMENILSDKAKNEQAKDTIPIDTPVKSIQNDSPFGKTRTPKTQRIALKDRVFKNMKNLMENAGLQDSPKILADFVVGNLKTPTTTKRNNLTCSSAPPKICADRPLRLIKKPKKFDDSELITIKKGIRSLNRSQSDTPVESEQVACIEYDNDAIPTKTLPADLNTQDTQPSQANIFDDIGVSVHSIEEAQKPDNHNMTDVIATKNCDDGLKLQPNTDCDSQKTTNSLKNTSLKPKTAIKKRVNHVVSPITKKTRIEKQLSIDMVEGHPFLNSRRKRTTNKHRSIKAIKPKLVEKKHILGSEHNTTVDKERTTIERTASEQTIQKRKRGRPPKVKREPPKKTNSTDETASVTVVDSQTTQEQSQIILPSRENSSTSTAVSFQDKSLSSLISCRDKSSTSTESSQDFASSEDIIESSQDSSITTISTKSSKILGAAPVNVTKPITRKRKIDDLTHHTQNALDRFDNDVVTITAVEKSNEDIELPKNKSVSQDRSQLDLTENMDTEPFDDKLISNSSNCIIIDDDEDIPIIISSEQLVGPDTLETAEADTEIFESTHAQVQTSPTSDPGRKNAVGGTIESNIQDDLTQTLNDENKEVSSPFRDDTQKKKEFLNDTVEISPIKTLSPVRHKKSPSPETSSEYVVIKLTSPVQSNGEPFNDKCDSPEIFIEDKTSPDKRDQSPPRNEVKTAHTSSPSSLSLKKNRTKVCRGSGRAAQIMGLCGPENSNAISDIERDEDEGLEKNSPFNTQAKRNLRILYGSVAEPQEHSDAGNSDENFLRFKRLIPTADSSPSGPILKRKLADIADDTITSPASKRKRVSFHDPPVSTTIAVQKYIEPCSIRSPQHSALKRQERQSRASPAHCTSQRRLDQFFKLDTVLTRAIESFISDDFPPEDSEMSSIDQTPAAEVVKTSDLNNTDPICADLLDCRDPISNIAASLSSPAMKDLLIKELEGKVDTVADLAKMTELEVNRLCIKAPKVTVAKQVLNSYAAMRNFSLNSTKFDANSNVTDNKTVTYVDTEAQTIVVPSKDTEMQTVTTPAISTSSQTEVPPISNAASQTNESGSRSTEEVISSCLSDRPDFIDQLGKQLQEADVSRIASNLSFNASLDLMMSKTNAENRDVLINRLLKDKASSAMTLLQFTEYLCKRFEAKDLILLCSKILKNVHENDGSA